MRFMILFQLFGILALNSCRPDYLPPSGYVKHIRNPENGFIQKETVSNLSVEAFYQPPEYIALMQSKPGEVNEKDIENTIERYANFYQFLVSIKPDNNIPVDEQLIKIVESEDSFRIKKEYMLYRLQHCFSLISEHDTLPCAFYHAQPGGKIDNAYHFIVAFEKSTPNAVLKRSQDFKLIYRDPIWFQRNFNFVFNNNFIDNTPKLKL